MGTAQQGMGMPPGTGMRGGPPGTGMRVPGTGMRMGTAMQPMGVGAATDVKVENRPVTQMGLGGVKTGTKTGAGRQIYDKSYYMMQIRNKISELSGELNGFNKELETIQKDKQLYEKSEKRYGDLVKTVRDLEGNLADYNLALDKHRSDSAPEEVQRMYMFIKQGNDQQREELDQCFLEKKSHEEEIAKMDEAIAAVRRSADERLSELHPDQRDEYQQLQEESERLQNELSGNGGQRQRLEMVMEHLNVLEERLRSDLLRMRAQELREQGNGLLEQRDTLQAAAQQASLSVPEQREMLLGKVKSDNAITVETEQQCTELKAEIQRCRKQITEMDTDISERKSEGNDQQKYEILLGKDQEMTAFIEGCDDTKREELAKTREKQENIVAALESISKSLTADKSINPQDQANDLEDELKFKNSQLQNAETTQNRLRLELDKRNGELEKIVMLDEKISGELVQLETKTAQHKHEIETKFDHIEEMRVQKLDQINELQKRKVLLLDRVEHFKSQINFLKLKTEGKKQLLLEDSVESGLQSQETKLQQFQQNVNHLQAFIAAKQGESDYSQELGTCLDMSEQINQILQRPKPNSLQR
jgi:intraflagellar transport protein 74